MVLFPEEAAMTLAELRQMAARQQHQIEAQQQLLVAKEQRLKFLKQQEARHHTFSEQQLDVACLQNLREKVETQEIKLRQLRALRSQVEQQKTNNVNLGTELDSIRALFSEKEKELSLAVNKVEELTRQLDDIKKNNRKHSIIAASSMELEKLKRELLYRTKLSEQQNNFICQQRENIAYRQQDISLLDKKINELTKRLHRKHLLNEQLASQIHNASLSKSSNSLGNTELYNSANIVAVEPILRDSQEPDHTQDDMSAKFHRSHKEDLGEFSLNKNDPKYQTLPYNTKFTLKGKQSEDSLSSSTEDELASTTECSTKKSSLLPTIKPAANMCNFSPRPFNHIVPRNLSQTLENGNSCQVFTPVEMKTSSSSENLETEKFSDKCSLDRWKNSSNNNIHKLLSPKENSSTGGESPSEENEGKNSSIIKPKIPPKPSLPVKPMLLNKHIPTMVIKKKSEEKDIVNAALSVLQNKTSDKSNFSNYRERLLYYRCIPRYSSSREISCDTTLGENKSAAYVSKSATEFTDSLKKHENTELHDISKHKPSFGQLPIKPKPLTIRKTPGLEPPKLKVQQLPLSSGIYRKSTDSNLLSMNMKISPNMPSLHVEPLKEEEQKMDKLQEMEENIPLPKKDLSTNASEENAAKVSEVSKTNDDSFLKATEKYTDDKILGKQLKEENSDASDPEISALKLDSQDIKEKQEEETYHSSAFRLVKKGNLKNESSLRNSRRVSFDPLALLLDAALEGELELVKKTAAEVPNPSAANDEGITALHNAICAGHFEVVTFLVEFGCDVNAQDSDGWTPLHCAASCNNLPMVKFLIERGACIFATTLSDHETAAEKCEEDEEGFDGCSEYLYSLQENLGVMNSGVVYAVYDYEVQNADELSFKDGDKLIVLRKGDVEENEWWWSRLMDEEGYVPRNLLGLFPRVKHRRQEELA